LVDNHKSCYKFTDNLFVDSSKAFVPMNISR
jgi:hypothetical protein